MIDRFSEYTRRLVDTINRMRSEKRAQERINNWHTFEWGVWRENPYHDGEGGEG